MRVLITGAGRGLGLEFARQYLEAGHRVFALARAPKKSAGLMELVAAHPERAVAVNCDVIDDASVAAAGRSVAAATEALDLILNNAGTYGRRDESLESLDWKEMREVLEVNTLGPLRVSRAFLPLLRAGKKPRLVQITSLMGSIDDNRSGGSWSYRISKAALNMANRNLAIELQREKIPAVVLHPGWVRTDMGGRGAPLEVEEAVSAMIAAIDGVTPADTGGFLDRFGKPCPW